MPRGDYKYGDLRKKDPPRCSGRGATAVRVAAVNGKASREVAFLAPGGMTIHRGGDDIHWKWSRRSPYNGSISTQVTCSLCIAGLSNFRVVFDGDTRFVRRLTVFYAWIRRFALYYDDSGIFVAALSIQR
jgi:hypothetical protein